MSVKDSGTSQHTLVGVTSWGRGCATVSTVNLFKGTGSPDEYFLEAIKGTVPRDFQLEVYSVKQFPPSPVQFFFFENSWRYSQLKVRHWCL
jgi:hypothetical protein